MFGVEEEFRRLREEHEREERLGLIRMLKAQPCERAGTDAPECCDIDVEFFGVCPRCSDLAKAVELDAACRRMGER
jgi:hypothetical protein